MKMAGSALLLIILFGSHQLFARFCIIHIAFLLFLKLAQPKSLLRIVSWDSCGMSVILLRHLQPVCRNTSNYQIWGRSIYILLVNLSSAYISKYCEEADDSFCLYTHCVNETIHLCECLPRSIIDIEPVHYQTDSIILIRIHYTHREAYPEISDLNQVVHQEKLNHFKFNLWFNEVIKVKFYSKLSHNT